MKSASLILVTSLWGSIPCVDWLVQVCCDDSLFYLTIFHFVKKNKVTFIVLKKCIKENIAESPKVNSRSQKEIEKGKLEGKTENLLKSIQTSAVCRQSHQSAQN